VGREGGVDGALLREIGGVTCERRDGEQTNYG
jgi:hypothetical protein